MVPLVFNIRMDPFESFNNKDACGHLMQKVSWLIQPMGELTAEQHQPPTRRAAEAGRMPTPGSGGRLVGCISGHSRLDEALRNHQSAQPQAEKTSVASSRPL